MSFNSEREAFKRAEKVVKKLNTKGWKINVWENLGWHYELLNSYMSLHEVSGTFYAMVSNSLPAGSGSAFWTVRNDPTFENPNDAVRLALKHVSTFVRKVKEVQKKLETALQR